MKLYDPSHETLPCYVWPMVPKAYKPGQQTTYQLTKDPSPKMAELQGYVMAGPCQVGMYDEEGFFCTFCPGVEGKIPGRYRKVLFGDALKTAKDDYESDRLYGKYGGKKELAI